MSWISYILHSVCLVIATAALIFAILAYTKDNDSTSNAPSVGEKVTTDACTGSSCASRCTLYKLLYTQLELYIGVVYVTTNTV